MTVALYLTRSCYVGRQKRDFSTCKSLGIQDASRKRTENYLTPCPWSGTVVHTSNKEVEITATRIKWEKTRSLVLELEKLMREDRLPHNRLECIRGFLIFFGQDFQVGDAIPQGPASDL